MSLITRYIQRKWFKSFFLSALVLYALLTAVNLISGLMRSSVKAWEVLVNHLLQTPAYCKFILPFSCLLASVLVIHGLMVKNELTAIFASGYKRKKVILSLTVTSFIVALAPVFNSLLLGSLFQVEKAPPY